MVVVRQAAAAIQATPDTARLAPFNLVRQKLNWEACDFKAAVPEPLLPLVTKLPGLACATVTVPMDWHNARNGKTIRLRISKTATAGAHRQGIILTNPGGPGEPGLPWGAVTAARTPELAAEFDFVGFDPRGVGASTAAPCTVVLPTEPAPSVDEESRLKAEACRNAPLARYITTEQTAYDMDFIRVLFGEARISYIGYSYGTWLGTWYANTFPNRVHRMLLDSAVDVSRDSMEHTAILQAPSIDRAFQERLLPYIARNNATYGLGTDPLTIRRKWEEVGGSRTAVGMIAIALLIGPALRDTASYPAAADAVGDLIKHPDADSEEPAESVNALVDRLLARPELSIDARGSVEQLRTKALESLRKGRNPAPVKTKTDVVNQPFELIRCQDGQWNQNPRYWADWKKDLQRNAPFIAPLMQTPQCMYWSTRSAMPRPPRGAYPRIMVAQSELDPATPYEAGLASAKYLPDAHLISVDNENNHGVFPYLTDCVDEPIIRYFRTGQQPDARFTACPGKPMPNETQTYPAGGYVTSTGLIKLRMVTNDVRRANELARKIIATQAIDPETGELI